MFARVDYGREQRTSSLLSTASVVNKQLNFLTPIDYKASKSVLSLGQFAISDTNLLLKNATAQFSNDKALWVHTDDVLHTAFAAVPSHRTEVMEIGRVVVSLAATASEAAGGPKRPNRSDDASEVAAAVHQHLFKLQTEQQLASIGPETFLISQDYQKKLRHKAYENELKQRQILSQRPAYNPLAVEQYAKYLLRQRMLTLGSTQRTWAKSVTMFTFAAAVAFVAMPYLAPVGAVAAATTETALLSSVINIPWSFNTVVSVYTGAWYIIDGVDKAVVFKDWRYLTYGAMKSATSLFIDVVAIGYFVNPTTSETSSTIISGLLNTSTGQIGNQLIMRRLLDYKSEPELAAQQVAKEIEAAQAAEQQIQDLLQSTKPKTTVVPGFITSSFGSVTPVILRSIATTQWMSFMKQVNPLCIFWGITCDKGLGSSIAKDGPVGVAFAVCGLFFAQIWSQMSSVGVQQVLASAYWNAVVLPKLISSIFALSMSMIRGFSQVSHYLLKKLGPRWSGFAMAGLTSTRDKLEWLEGFVWFQYLRDAFTAIAQVGLQTIMTSGIDAATGMSYKLDPLNFTYFRASVLSTLSNGSYQSVAEFAPSNFEKHDDIRAGDVLYNLNTETGEHEAMFTVEQKTIDLRTSEISDVASGSDATLNVLVARSYKYPEITTIIDQTNVAFRDLWTARLPIGADPKKTEPIFVRADIASGMADVFKDSMANDKATWISDAIKAGDFKKVLYAAQVSQQLAQFRSGLRNGISSAARAEQIEIYANKQAAQMYEARQTFRQSLEDFKASVDPKWSVEVYAQRLMQQVFLENPFILSSEVEAMKAILDSAPIVDVRYPEFAELLGFIDGNLTEGYETMRTLATQGARLKDEWRPNSARRIERDMTKYLKQQQEKLAATGTVDDDYMDRLSKAIPNPEYQYHVSSLFMDAVNWANSSWLYNRFGGWAEQGVVGPEELIASAESAAAAADGNIPELEHVHSSEQFVDAQKHVLRSRLKMLLDDIRQVMPNDAELFEIFNAQDYVRGVLAAINRGDTPEATAQLGNLRDYLENTIKHRLTIERMRQDRETRESAIGSIYLQAENVRERAMGVSSLASYFLENPNLLDNTRLGLSQTIKDVQDQVLTKLTEAGNVGLMTAIGPKPDTTLVQQMIKESDDALQSILERLGPVLDEVVSKDRPVWPSLLTNDPGQQQRSIYDSLRQAIKVSKMAMHQYAARNYEYQEFMLSKIANNVASTRQDASGFIEDVKQQVDPMIENSLQSLSEFDKITNDVLVAIDGQDTDMLTILLGFQDVLDAKIRAHHAVDLPIQAIKDHVIGSSFDLVKDTFDPKDLTGESARVTMLTKLAYKSATANQNYQNAENIFKLVGSFARADKMSDLKNAEFSEQVWSSFYPEAIKLLSGTQPAKDDELLELSNQIESLLRATDNNKNVDSQDSAWVEAHRGSASKPLVSVFDRITSEQESYKGSLSTIGLKNLRAATVSYLKFENNVGPETSKDDVLDQLSVIEADLKMYRASLISVIDSIPKGAMADEDSKALKSMLMMSEGHLGRTNYDDSPKSQVKFYGDMISLRMRNILDARQLMLDKGLFDVLGYNTPETDDWLATEAADAARSKMYMDAADMAGKAFGLPGVVTGLADFASFFVIPIVSKRMAPDYVKPFDQVETRLGSIEEQMLNLRAYETKAFKEIERENLAYIQAARDRRAQEQQDAQQEQQEQQKIKDQKEHERAEEQKRLDDEYAKDQAWRANRRNYLQDHDELFTKKQRPASVVPQLGLKVVGGGFISDETKKKLLGESQDLTYDVYNAAAMNGQTLDPKKFNNMKNAISTFISEYNNIVKMYHEIGGFDGYLQELQDTLGVIVRGRGDLIYESLVHAESTTYDQTDSEDTRPGHGKDKITAALELYAHDQTRLQEIKDAIHKRLSEEFKDYLPCVTKRNQYAFVHSAGRLVAVDVNTFEEMPEITDFCLVDSLVPQMGAIPANIMNMLGGTSALSGLMSAGLTFGSSSSAVALNFADIHTVQNVAPRAQETLRKYNDGAIDTSDERLAALLVLTGVSISTTSNKSKWSAEANGFDGFIQPEYTQYTSKISVGDMVLKHSYHAMRFIEPTRIAQVSGMIVNGIISTAAHFKAGADRAAAIQSLDPGEWVAKNVSLFGSSVFKDFPTIWLPVVAAMLDFPDVARNLTLDKDVLLKMFRSSPTDFFKTVSPAFAGSVAIWRWREVMQILNATYTLASMAVQPQMLIDTMTVAGMAAELTGSMYADLLFGTDTSSTTRRYIDGMIAEINKNSKDPNGSSWIWYGLKTTAHIGDMATADFRPYVVSLLNMLIGQPFDPTGYDIV